MEPRTLNRAAGVVIAIVVLAVAAWGARAVVRRGHGASGASDPAPRAAPTVHAPAGVRIRVEVLNATRVVGLARRATFYLRDAGFDVVASGNAPAAHDSTLVIDRSGHPAWAALVARTMGAASAVTRRDSSSDVDVTVLVGASWRPPPEPFYP